MTWHQHIARVEDGQMVQLQSNSRTHLQVQCLEVSPNNQLTRINKILRNCMRLCSRSKRKYSTTGMPGLLPAVCPSKGLGDNKLLQTDQDQEPPKLPQLTRHLSKNSLKVTIWEPLLRDPKTVSYKITNRWINCIKTSRERKQNCQEFQLTKMP